MVLDLVFFLFRHIINHYEDLPDFTIFMHGDRYQWHNDDPIYGMLVIYTGERGTVIC